MATNSSSVDAAYEALRRANPEPDPNALRESLKAAPSIPPQVFNSRRDKMTTTTQAPSPKVKNPNRWLPSLATAVVIILVAGFLVARANPSLFGPATPLEIANEYMEARNAFDASRAQELINPDAAISDTPIIGYDELELGYEMLQIYGFQYEPYACEEFGALVRCTYQMTSELQRIVGAPPVEGEFDIFVEEGRIDQLYHGFNFDDFGPNFEAFIDWIGATHPESFDQLFREQGAVATPVLTRESLDLAATYLPSTTSSSTANSRTQGS